MVLSTELPTVDHHDSIKLSVRWWVWKVGEGLTSRVSPKTLKWVAVYSSVTFHINGWHNDRSALCLYTVTGWGVVSCVWGMAFLCGSTLVKVPLLQADTVAIWPQMFQSDVKPKQTNKTKLNMSKKYCNFYCYASQVVYNVGTAAQVHSMVVSKVFTNHHTKVTSSDIWRDILKLIT